MDQGDWSHNKMIALSISILLWFLIAQYICLHSEDFSFSARSAVVLPGLQLYMSAPAYLYFLNLFWYTQISKVGRDVQARSYAITEFHLPAII
jgi:hypothetical protein